LKRLRVAKGEKRHVLKNVNALLYKIAPDPLRDALCPNFIVNWRPMQQRLKNQSVHKLSLENFSFAKDPEGTLHQLRALGEACAIFPDLRVNFSDTDCDDVTPYIVLAHLSRSLPPIISGGQITQEVSDVVDAVGMQRALRIGTIRRKSRDKGNSVSAFPLFDRTPPGAFGDKDHLLRPQVKEYVSDRFCDTLNAWLRAHTIELTPEAEGAFTGAIGEALDNAERHGSLSSEKAEGDWSIAAFSKISHSGDSKLIRCSVGIVSIGATISESLNSAASEVKERIDKYVKQHTPLLSRGPTAECLRTVMALQDGITRVGKATEGRRGGVGFMELVDIFAELGKNGRDDLQSMLTILSGKACIRITRPFEKGTLSEEQMRQLWFNDENVMSHPPKGSHVQSLEIGFPGVILSACFTIDPTYLREHLDT